MFLSYCLQGKTLSGAIFEIEWELAHSPYGAVEWARIDGVMESGDGQDRIVRHARVSCQFAKRSETRTKMNTRLIIAKVLKLFILRMGSAMQLSSSVCLHSPTDVIFNA